MKITSTAFNDGEEIPEKHTFDGENARPPLHFEDVPGDAKSHHPTESASCRPEFPNV